MATVESRPDSAEWSDYNLNWLFDPDRHDHLPIEEQLKLYKQRDLKRVKAYKYAVQIWGGPRSRKRVMEAKERLSPIGGGVEISQHRINAELKPKPLPKIATEEEPKEVLRAREEKAKIDDYRSWVNERKSFRKNLEHMGLQESSLRRKPNKTPLEQRVLRRMMEESNKRPPTPPPEEEEPKTPVLPEEPPTVRRPSPLAVKILEQFLHKNKMRLIDLLQNFDKDKSWTVSRDEFRQAIKYYKVPISDVLLEDLILTLDIDLNDELDYRELAKGMGFWKLEKRESKKEMVTSDEVNSSPTKFSQVYGYDPPEINPEDEPESVEKTTRMSSASTTSSRHLEPPEPDTREEQLVLSSPEAMVDLRKQNREVLNRYDKKKSTFVENSVVRTMDSTVDKHLIPTTLTGDTAELHQKFRLQKYKEYLEVCQLCEERGIMLTDSLLQKVLLYPSDKPHQQLKKNLRQPAMPLISNKFHTQNTLDSASPISTSPIYNTRSRSRSPGQKLASNRPQHGANSGKRTSLQQGHQHHHGAASYSTKSPRNRSKFKQTFTDTRQDYRSRSEVRSVPQKQKLSTGKALISKKVDCWMTFEEYDRLTRQMGGPSMRVAGKSDDNAFWPGYMLDKLRLCLPEPVPKASSVFTVVKHSKVVY